MPAPVATPHLEPLPALPLLDAESLCSCSQLLRGDGMGRGQGSCWLGSWCRQLHAGHLAQLWLWVFSQEERGSRALLTAPWGWDLAVMSCGPSGWGLNSRRGCHPQLGACPGCAWGLCRLGRLWLHRSTGFLTRLMRLHFLANLQPVILACELLWARTEAGGWTRPPESPALGSQWSIGSYEVEQSRPYP